MVQAEELRLRTVAAVANPLMQFTHRAGAAQVDLDDAARGAEQCGSLTVQKCPPDLRHPAPDTRPAEPTASSRSESDARAPATKAWATATVGTPGGTSARAEASHVASTPSWFCRDPPDGSTNPGGASNGSR